MTTIMELPQNSRSGPSATPIAFIRAIILAYRRYGIDPANALRQAQISRKQLADPESRVNAAQMEIMSGVAMQELDDEALGWFSRRLPWGSYGMLCRASLSSPNLGVALKRWCRHHRLLTDDIVLTLGASKRIATLAIETRRKPGPMQEFCLVSSLRYVLGYASWAIDSRIELLETRFPFAAPAHQSVYPLLFPGGPVRFAAEPTGISFDAHYLSLPLQRDERALRTMLQRALPLTVLQYRRDRLLVQRVRKLLSLQVGEAFTADSIADRLHVSTRTLHRQLREEGASLQQLKDEIRRDHAMELLARSAKPVKQVAMAAGFRNEKSFARAFRHWTGETPSAFRDKTRMDNQKAQ
jgi:AraC-like DNA-binding protein